MVTLAVSLLTQRSLELRVLKAVVLVVVVQLKKLLNTTQVNNNARSLLKREVFCAHARRKMGLLYNNLNWRCIKIRWSLKNFW